MYFGDYLLVNLGQIRGRKCSENHKIIGPSAFGEKREPLLIGHSGASSPPIGRSAYNNPGDHSSRVSVKFFGFKGCKTCILETICWLT